MPLSKQHRNRILIKHLDDFYTHVTPKCMHIIQLYTSNSKKNFLLLRCPIENTAESTCYPDVFVFGTPVAFIPVQRPDMRNEDQIKRRTLNEQGHKL